MNQNCPGKIECAKEKFSRFHFTRRDEMVLKDLTFSQSIVVMPVRLRSCNDTGVFNGGDYSPLGNAASVTLASLHSEYFTPLVVDLVRCLRPTVVGRDNSLTAVAIISKKSRKRITIRVEFRSDSDDRLKAIGIFRYALLSREYTP